MESAVSFAPLRPADFVNFAGGARPAFFGAGQPVFPLGGAGRPSLVVINRMSPVGVAQWKFKKTLKNRKDFGDLLPPSPPSKSDKTP